MKNRLDALLKSFNNKVQYDTQFHDIIKETRIRAKRLLLDVTVIKYKNSNHHEVNKEVEEQINIFLEIYETIEMGLEEISINYMNDVVMGSGFIRNLLTDMNGFEDIMNKLEEEIIKTNEALIDLEKTFNNANEMNTINFKNYISKKDLESFKSELRVHLDSINEKVKNYEIKKINFN